jgi:type VI secretion system protein ImpM
MSQNVAAPGFFGKAPARGDFLVRRMPAGFQTTWETWLSTFVLAARDGLGPDWPDGWLTAPLWHFSLGRDIVAPFGAAGVLLASVDRVGRFFPLSIIGAAAPGSALRPDDWAHAAEALALAALDDDFDPDRLDASLRDLGPPPSPAGIGRIGGVWRLPMENDWPARPFDALSEAAWMPPGPGQSVWWCRGSERMVPVHIRADGLPDQRLAAAMVTGLFDPADGGDAATDPGCLAIVAAVTPLPDPVTMPDHGDARHDGAVPEIAAVIEDTPVMAVAAAMPVESGGADPLGYDPVWNEAEAPATGDVPLPPSDPLVFLVRDDDPLADRPMQGRQISG